MREARVKKIGKLDPTGEIRNFRNGRECVHEIYYDQREPHYSDCPMIWRTYAVDELDMWVKFKKWFAEQSEGDLTNVIWL